MQRIRDAIIGEAKAEAEALLKDARRRAGEHLDSL